jgi:hypothetical protein
MVFAGIPSAALSMNVALPAFMAKRTHTIQEDVFTVNVPLASMNLRVERMPDQVLLYG